MANICEHLILAKGTKKAALMAFASTSKIDDFDCICKEFGTDDEYVVWYQGACKWSLDAYSKESNNVEIDLSKLSEDDLRNGEGYDFWDFTMRQRSEVLGLGLFAHPWSAESEFGTYERWKDGRVVFGAKKKDFEMLKAAEGIVMEDGLGDDFWNAYLKYMMEQQQKNE